MDLAAYRASAERFIGELSLEYYRHYAGLQDDFGIEAVYDRHTGLFTEQAVLHLRELVVLAPEQADERRRLRMLLSFAVEGHLARATKESEAELARREAGLRVEVDGAPIGFRESALAQANEPDAARRHEIEAARLQVTEEELNPLRLGMLEQTHSLSRDLGWPSHRHLCEDLSGIDLGALGRETRAFTDATATAYPGILEPELRRTLGIGLKDLRRADLPRFFRAAHADDLFPEERLVASFRETMAGLGIDIDTQANVVLDVERRPNKSPRAFCAPVRVPDEVYLVVPPIGGQDDYSALFHEGGHTEHFAWVDPNLPFEFRMLGDNSVTEGFAFLFDHLVEDPEWLRRRLGIENHDALTAHSRAQRLLFARRYAAKLAYELELHDTDADLAAMPSVYAGRLSAATGVDWPQETWLVDVDPGFYAANYLRAWSLETHLRAELRSRFGEAWFEEPSAGDFLKDLWSQGQRLDADELLDEINGAELDFSAMLDDLGLATESSRGPATG